MTEKILIIDFGSQYTQLIARRIREMQVYCEIHPFNNVPALDESIKGVVMSGSPRSVREEGAPRIDLDAIKGKLAETVYQLVGGIRAGMGYCGAKDIETLQTARFIRITSSGVTENHPHDITITSETPNYSRGE